MTINELKITRIDNSVDIDARDLINHGGEPFHQVLAEVGKLAQGQMLSLHTPFEPHPIKAHLAKMGFAPSCRHVGEDHWITSISKQ